jgi:Asp/Glu/hydantoin racemase
LRRLLIVNPNANAQVTAWLAEEARRVAPADVAIEALNAESGLMALETPEHVRIASEAVVRAISDVRPDAALIGAFGDPGLAEARLLGFKVEGLGEAGLESAARRRFAIVTLGAAMREPIERRVAALGLVDQLVGIRFLAGAIADYVADRDGRLVEVARDVEACAAAGAETVLLGGAPFAGQARRLRGLGVRVVDGVKSAVAAIALH